MAALCPGVQYGLSSQENFRDKHLIFVKLTDSCLRAIDDHLQNRSKFSTQGPSIKFLGNEGQISIPGPNGAGTAFTFSMSSTADMEGPGGSFECIQQTSPPRGQLSVLGSIPHKIRIHANEDVYEATRHRMTVAEENHKNKRTREIKPNETDIGRKVKVKQSRTATIPPLRKENNIPVRESLTKPSYQSNNVPSKPLVHTPSSNGLSNGLGSNHVSSTRPPQNKPSVPDIARRPIRERLIHLLALRPHKKPELYERLTKEGHREKKSMSSVLKQISSLKDNCYHLNRAMWNDVHEDWPFYTESERMILKRRKPQNLTPPGSSDSGSSGSGQSPTSTHPGSPPPIPTSKRPGYYDGADGLPTKRQRISHYRKPPGPEQTYRSPIENNSQRRPVTDSRDASNMNPRSRESTPNGYLGSVSNGYSMLNGRHTLSDEEDNAGKNRSCDSHSLSFTAGREKTFTDSRSASPLKTVEEVRREPLADRNEVRNGFMNGLTNGRCNDQEVRDKDNKDRNNKYNGKVSSSPNKMISCRVSPDSQSSEVITSTDSGPPTTPSDQEKRNGQASIPDYQTEYTTINSAEQRAKYKADFNADYAEYKRLHALTEKVSRRFAELEEIIKRESKQSPRYRDLQKQIIREYQENKRDLHFQRSKQRYMYLHEKLSHIKTLVSEYDQRNRY